MHFAESLSDDTPEASQGIRASVFVSPDHVCDHRYGEASCPGLIRNHKVPSPCRGHAHRPGIRVPPAFAVLPGVTPCPSKTKLLLSTPTYVALVTSDGPAETSASAGCSASGSPTSLNSSLRESSASQARKMSLANGSVNSRKLAGTSSGAANRSATA